MGKTIAITALFAYLSVSVALNFAFYSGKIQLREVALQELAGRE